MKENKGCVYFFKHIGLDPIKIGYSSHISPISRFEQFKTYAPFGAELIGFITTKNPFQLESFLHNKYYSFRLSGEWFDIKVEDAEREIKFYSEIEEVKEKNDFQIEWARRKHENQKREALYGEHIPNGILEFFKQYVEFGNPIYYSIFFDLFKEELGDSFPEINTTHSLTKYLKEYCVLNEFNYISKASNGSRYHLITKRQQL